MTQPQMILFALMGSVLALLLWGRIRHDLVAMAGLLIGVIVGVVPEKDAFSGFAHPAVIVVALVLIASRALENSGALSIIARRIVRPGRPIAVHIAVIGGVGAALSAFINNVAALALLMPIDINTARKAGRSPRLTLMPLAFATILGGLVTLIGTPPNIVASTFRQDALGAPYRMFDFAPVGLVCAITGILFIAFGGWRLIPRAKAGRQVPEPARIDDFVVELAVSPQSPAIGRLVAQLDDESEAADVVILGLIRDGRRLPGRARFATIREGDLFEVEGSADAVAAFIKALALEQAKDDISVDAPEAEDAARAGEPALVETVVRADSRIAWRSAEAFRLRSRFGVTLLGISRQGRTFRERISSRIIEPGDMLLLTGPQAALAHVVNWLGTMPLSETSVQAARTWRVVVALGLFIGAIIAASTSFISFTTAIAIAVVGYAATGLVTPREVYDQVDWPVVVMLAALLPLSAAFESVGGTALVANLIVAVTQGHSPVVALVGLMLVTVILSDMLNNVATMVIAGPVAIETARTLSVNPDAFLMATVVAASLAFLTPIGHKNNTLIMGPGGYSFGDYWRLGLPLEILMVSVSIPVILVVWPL
ncbi:Citrate transporter [Chelatococcus sambhunathii]|uniref:Citrate transporter n=1 Tax=Chelatococcus sambhunathii TaxID=363953 RepID=A0ABP2AAK3_9HYPH|nr:SLC13 family permease [Chelatococcus sambhunathii]CUA88639.1 Citrate transporter [Chelatococcus sambhunathii]